MSKQIGGVQWRRFHRGALWLLVAVLGFWSIDHLDWTGLSAYSIRRLGALLTIAATVWGGYRVTRDVLRIDPSRLVDERARATAHLARAVVIGLFAVAACVSV